VADLLVDPDTRRVERAGKALDLTPKEFELLAYLIRHTGLVVTREMLAREV
jgi:DNA-binding response OmpR family regulator